MASSQDIRAGRAFVELFVDRNPLVRGLNLASRDIAKWGQAISSAGKTVLAAGSAILAPILAATKVFADSGHDLMEMSKRTGMSVEALSQLGYAAEMSGVNMEDFEGAVRKMQRSIYDAATQGGDAAKAFKTLGLDVGALAKEAPDQQIEALADALAAIPNPTERAAVAMKVFGRGGTAMLPMLAEGAEGIRQLRQEAADLGLTKSTASAQAGEQLAQGMKVLWKTVKGLTNAVGSALAPVLTDVYQRMARLVAGAASWIRQNQAVVQAVAALGAGLMVAGAALITFGKALTISANIIKTFTTIGSLVTAALSPIAAILSGLLTPLGLVAAAVAGLAGYFIYASGAAGEAITWLGGVIRGLVTDAQEAWTGIASALGAGDIALAARVLWLTLKMEWTKGVAALQQIWQPIRSFFEIAFTQAVYGALATWEIFVAGVRQAWVTLVSVLKAVWIGFSSWYQQAVNTTAGWIAKRMVEVQGLFDSNLDVGKAKQYIDQQVSADQSKIQDERKQALDANQADSQQRIAAVTSQRDDRLAAIGQAYEDSAKTLKTQQDARLAAVQADLEQAKSEFRSAIDAARQEGQAAKPAVGGPPDLQDRIGGAGDLVGSATKTVLGTFNPAAAWGLGSPDTSAQIAQNTKKTADGVDSLNRRMAKGITYGR